MWGPQTSVASLMATFLHNDSVPVRCSSANKIVWGKVTSQRGISNSDELSLGFCLMKSVLQLVSIGLHWRLLGSCSGSCRPKLYVRLLNLIPRLQ